MNRAYFSTSIYMNRVGFEILIRSFAPIWHRSYPHPLPVAFFCFQWITYSELSIQLMRLKCTIKMEKEGLYISALDNAKLKLPKLLSSNFNVLIFFKRPSLYMYSWIVSLQTEDIHTFSSFKWFLMFILFISLKL